jgi:Ser/Thr protein kinase RdoA (MazF antagonist)
VRPFDQLTDRGRLARLCRLGADALAAWGEKSPAAPMTVVGQSFNTVFRVDERGTGGDQTRALRVSPAFRIHTAGTEEAEARWVEDLHRDGVETPRLFRTIDGAAAAQVERPDVPGVRTCTLMEWANGTPLVGAMTADRAANMGRLAATLHAHTAGRQPTATTDVLVADRVLYWQLDDRVSTLSGFGSLFVDALDRASRSVHALWNDPSGQRQLVHGDFTPSNVLVDGERITPIDFQDLVWAMDVQDLAITRSSYLRLERTDELWSNFRAGYEHVRPWPQLDSALWDALVAARRLHVLNLALTVRNAELEEYVARAADFFREWMAREK